MLQEGQILKDRYRIKSVLGKGAYGTVYLSEDLTIQQVEWAVKEIDEISLSREEAAEAIERFERETETLRRLNHPGIPKAVEFFSQGRCHYLVMEYIEGRNFEEYCRGVERYLAPEEILPWMIKLCDILEYLHTQSPPIIFRDVKPANIIITSGGRIKLVDFGISRSFDPEKTSDTQQLGTPGFCAPEQYGISQSDARSDIYSVGATMYHILSEQDVSKFNFAFPPLRHYNTKVSGKLDRIILKCVNRDAGLRYQSAKELGDALAGFKESTEAAGRRSSIVNGIMTVFDLLMSRAAIFVVFLFLLLAFLSILSDRYYDFNLSDFSIYRIIRILEVGVILLLPPLYIVYRIIRFNK